MTTQPRNAAYYRAKLTIKSGGTADLAGTDDEIAQLEISVIARLCAANERAYTLTKIGPDLHRLTVSMPVIGRPPGPKRVAIAALEVQASHVFEGVSDGRKMRLIRTTAHGVGFDLGRKYSVAYDRKASTATVTRTA